QRPRTATARLRVLPPRDCTGTSRRSMPRSRTDCGRRCAALPNCAASASTPGPSTTGCCGPRLIGLPHHYRDRRTARGVALVHERIDPAELFARNGLQHLDFNTVFQLAAESESGLLDAADRILLVPDLIAYWLTGTARTEATNAST